jgi:hypothetical protein
MNRSGLSEFLPKFKESLDGYGIKIKSINGGSTIHVNMLKSAEGLFHLSQIHNTDTSQGALEKEALRHLPPGYGVSTRLSEFKPVSPGRKNTTTCPSNVVLEIRRLQE